jgi:TnpA family transposase
LIETHWSDLMRVVLSIRAGKLSSVALLRRLRHDSRKNKPCGRAGQSRGVFI